MQMFDIGKELQKAYDEGYVRGVEDFAEKLKNKMVCWIYDFQYNSEVIAAEREVDDLVKEMTEKEGGKV